MADSAQRSRILQKLAEVWELHPDWRLGQVISNLGNRDVFYIEDDKWEALLGGKSDPGSL